MTPPAFTQQGVLAQVQLAANLPKAKLVVDSDRRKVTLVGGQATTTESAIGFTGEIAPFPAKATVAYAKAVGHAGGDDLRLRHDQGRRQRVVHLRRQHR